MPCCPFRHLGCTKTRRRRCRVHHHLMAAQGTAAVQVAATEPVVQALACLQLCIGLIQQAIADTACRPRRTSISWLRRAPSQSRSQQRNQ